MAEISQPTPIKPIWPTRREDSKGKSKNETEDQAATEEKPSDTNVDKAGSKDGGKSSGHQIDEYA